MRLQSNHAPFGRRVLAFALFVLIANSTAQSQVPPVELTLATGSEQGLYHRIGLEIANNLRQHGIGVRVVPSFGSVDNLALLASNQVQISIAQADVLGQHSPSGEIQALVPLYTEAVHILIRKPVRVLRTRNLEGRRISVGPAGGGTERNAMAILEAAGVVRHDSPITRNTFEATAQALTNGGLDAAFITIGCPSLLVEDLMRSRCVSLFEPDSDVIEELLDTIPGLMLSSIPAGTYTHQEGTVKTLGVPAMLVVRADMSVSLAERITGLIASDLPGILDRSRIRGDRQSVSGQMGRLKLPVHPGAMKYYERQQGYVIAVLIHWGHLTGIPILLVLAILWVGKKRERISFFFSRHPTARAVLFLLSVWLIGSCIMYVAERRLNDNYASLSASLWAALVNWINFGSKEPISALGRFISTAMTICGIGGITWLAGVVAAVFIEKLSNAAYRCKHMNDHFVIINWNATGLSVVDKIREMQEELGTKGGIIFVGAPSTVALPNGVVASTCDPLSDSIVDKTNMKYARSVIVLSAEGISEDAADTRNILIGMNLAQLLPKAEAGKPRKPNIAVEVRDPGKVHLLNAVRPPLDVVSSNALSTDLIVQVAGNPGLTRVYDDLLSNGAGTSEIYSAVLDKKWHGRTFADLCAACVTLRQKGVDILPLAISRGGEVHVNPSSCGTINEIKAGDVLFAVCDCPKNLQQLNPTA